MRHEPAWLRVLFSRDAEVRDLAALELTKNWSSQNVDRKY